MVLSGGIDLMSPLDSVDGYCSSLAVLVCFFHVTSTWIMSSGVPTSECSCCVSVPISVTSVDPVGLRYGSHYALCYQLKFAAQRTNLQPVVAAEVK